MWQDFNKRLLVEISNLQFSNAIHKSTIQCVVLKFNEVVFHFNIKHYNMLL